MFCWRDSRLTPDLQRQKSQNQNVLLDRKEAPEYMREFAINSGYRPKLSYRSCFVSWFLLHNETINIWSHFLGFAVFFYCLGVTILYPPAGYRTWTDLVPLILQLISYQICLLSSALFHTFSCHSEQTHRNWMETDHFGIVTALFGTYISIVCNFFHCYQEVRNVHLAGVVVFFTTISLLTFHPGMTKSFPFLKREKGGMTLWVFIFLSAYFLIPCGHWVWLKGGIGSEAVLRNIRVFTMPYLAGGIGLCFYISKFPENTQYGYFDIFGASHQVWHVMIFLGMFSWYYEMSSFFNMPSNNICDF